MKKTTTLKLLLLLCPVVFFAQLVLAAFIQLVLVEQQKSQTQIIVKVSEPKVFEGDLRNFAEAKKIATRKYKIQQKKQEYRVDNKHPLT